MNIHQLLKIENNNLIWQELIQKTQYRAGGNRYCIFLFLGFSGVGDYKFYEKGSDVGCFQLENDVLPVEIKPLGRDHLLLIAVGDIGTGNKELFEVANGMAKVC